MSNGLHSTKEDSMNTLCKMVVETTYENLPRKVVAHAKRSILDTIGVIVGGSAMEGISLLVDFIIDKGGKPESIIPFYGCKVPASEAGLALGPMARAMDFGDMHEESGHSSEYTVPTLLAANGLKDKVTGKELITSYVVGMEVLIRIGMAFKGVSKGLFMGRGLGHSIFGCVAAAGKLLGLSLAELKNAQGIARAMTQPHDQAMYIHPNLMVRIHHGFVCQDAINVCLLARRGITGPHQEILMAPRGYLGFAKWQTDPDALTKNIGEEWEMLNTVMKPYPACKCTHTSIDGILEQMEKHNFKAEDITRIYFDESSVNWSIACEPKETKWNPQTVAECQFSLPYLVATAAYDRHISLDSYTSHAIARQNVRKFMNRIFASEDPNLPEFAARIDTKLNDGREFSTESIYPKGHPNNPFTEQELIDKFKTCVPYSACKLSDEAVDSVIEAIINLEKVEDVLNALIIPLTTKIPN